MKVYLVSLNQVMVSNSLMARADPSSSFQVNELNHVDIYRLCSSFACDRAHFFRTKKEKVAFLLLSNVTFHPIRNRQLGHYQEAVQFCCCRHVWTKTCEACCDRQSSTSERLLPAVPGSSETRTPSSSITESNTTQLPPAFSPATSPTALKTDSV